MAQRTTGTTAGAKTREWIAVVVILVIVVVVVVVVVRMWRGALGRVVVSLCYR